MKKRDGLEEYAILFEIEKPEWCSRRMGMSVICGVSEFILAFSPSTEHEEVAAYMNQIAGEEWN